MAKLLFPRWNGNTQYEIGNYFTFISTIYLVIQRPEKGQNPTTNPTLFQATFGTGTGIKSFNALTAAVQTFARTNDTNVTLTISSVTGTHTFTLGWTGTLADARIASAATWNAKLSGNQTITLSGDVSGSGATAITTAIGALKVATAMIQANAVTYAKMQAVSAVSKLLGSSSTTTPVQEIVLGTGLSISGTTLSCSITGITAKGSFSQAVVATTSFTVTIGSTLPSATYQVNVTPTSALSAAVFYVTNKTTTSFDVVYLAGLTGTVTFDYILAQ